MKSHISLDDSQLLRSRVISLKIFCDEKTRLERGKDERFGYCG